MLERTSKSATTEHTKRETIVLRIPAYSVVVSAYPKAWEIKDYNKRIEAVQRFINDSDIKYVEPNKKRIQTWLKRTRLSLPIGVKFGFNDILSDTNRFVKGSD